MPSPGSLNQRVTFYRKQQTKDEAGTLVTTPKEIITCWAEVKPKSGTQRNQSQQTENPADFEITVRNNNVTRTITGADYVEWRGHQMNITWAPPASPRDLYLHVDAKAGVTV